MLHYSNASSIEKRVGDIWWSKGGLAWLLWQGGVIFDVVEHTDIGSGLGVYQKEEGEETMNTMQTDA